MLAAQPRDWPKFTRFRGTTKRLRFALVDETGAPFAHAGCTLLFTLKADPAKPDTTALIQKLSLVGGFHVVDDTTIEVELLPIDDVALTVGETYHFDIKAVDGPTEKPWPSIVARGTFTLQESVTHGSELAVPTIVATPASAYLAPDEIEANRAAAEQAAQAAAADAAQTALDRTATGADRTATGQDRTAAEQAAQAAAAHAQQTAADAQQTAADAQQTAADRSQTVADRQAVQAHYVETEGLRDETLSLRNQTATLRSEAQTAADASLSLAQAAASARSGAEEARDQAASAVAGAIDALTEAASLPLLIASDLVGAIDAANKRGYLLLLDIAETAIVFEGVGTAPLCRRFQLIVKQDAIGGRTISWPVNIVWAGASAIQTAPATVTIFEFHTTDGGVTFYGNRVYPTSVSVEAPEIVLDDFNRANGGLGIASSGGAWEIPTGSFEVAANKAKTVESSGNSHAWLDAGFSGPYKLTVDIISANAAGRTSVGLLLRVVDVNNYILLLIANDAGNGGGLFRLFRRQSGSYVSLTGGGGSIFGANVAMTVEVTYADGVIRVRRDGTTLIVHSLTPSEITLFQASSKVGFRADAGAATDNGTSSFDNLRIKRL